MNSEQKQIVLNAFEALYLEVKVTPSNVHIMKNAEQIMRILREDIEPVAHWKEKLLKCKELADKTNKIDRERIYGRVAAEHFDEMQRA